MWRSIPNPYNYYSSTSSQETYTPNKRDNAFSSKALVRKAKDTASKQTDVETPNGNMSHEEGCRRAEAPEIRTGNDREK